MRQMWIVAGVLGAAALTVALSGCADVRYLTQAAGGQLDLLRRARPLADVLADPATSAAVRRKLQLAADVLSLIHI